MIRITSILLVTLLLTSNTHCACPAPEILEGLGLTPLLLPKTGGEMEPATEFYKNNGGQCVEGSEIKPYFDKKKDEFTVAQRETMANTNDSIKDLTKTLGDFKGAVKNVKDENKKASKGLEDERKKIIGMENGLKEPKRSKKEIIYFDLVKFIEEILTKTSADMKVGDLKGSKPKLDEAKTKNDPRNAKGGDGKEKKMDVVLQELKAKNITKIEDAIAVRDVVEELIEEEEKRLTALNARMNELMTNNEEIRDKFVEEGGITNEDGELVLPADWKDEDVIKDIKEISDAFIGEDGLPVYFEDIGPKKPEKPEEGKGKPADKRRLLEGTETPAGVSDTSVPKDDDRKKTKPKDLFHDMKPFRDEEKKVHKKLHDLYKFLDEVYEKIMSIEKKEFTDDAKNRRGDNTLSEAIYFDDWMSIPPIERNKAAIQTKLDEIKVLLESRNVAFDYLADAMDFLMNSMGNYNDLETEFDRWAYGENEEFDSLTEPSAADLDKTFENITKDIKFEGKREKEEELAAASKRRMLEATTEEVPEEESPDYSIDDELKIIDDEMKKAKDEFVKSQLELKGLDKQIGDKIKEILADVTMAENTEPNKDLRKTYIEEALAEIEKYVVHAKDEIVKLNVTLKDDAVDKKLKKEALDKIKGFNKIWKELKRLKTFLADWTAKITAGTDVADYMSILEKIAMRGVNRSKLEVQKMKLELERIEKDRTMDGVNEDEIVNMELELEELENLVVDVNALSDTTFRNKENRDKCYKGQFKVLSGVVLAMTSGRASEVIELDSTGKLSQIPVEKAAAEEVVDNCIDILLSTCIVLKTSSELKKFSKTKKVNKKFSKTAQACDSIDKIYACMLDKEACDDELTKDLMEAMFKPFDNGMENKEKPNDMVGGIVKDLKDKKGDLTFTEDPEAKELLSEFDLMEEQSEFDFNEEGVDVYSTVSDPVEGEEADDVGGDVDADIVLDTAILDAELKALVDAATAETRILASSSSDVTFKVDDATAIKVMAAATGAVGLDSNSVEDSIKSLASIGDKDEEDKTSTTDSPASVSKMMVTFITIILTIFV